MESLTKTGGPEKGAHSAKLTSHLDAATAEFLDGFSKAFSSIANLPLPEQRAIDKEMGCISEDQLESIAKTENKRIPGRHGSITIRLFSPSHKTHLPVIVYFHRGGWVYGSIEESEMMCRRLANETGAIVAAVEYPLAPENKFPIPLEACYDAAKWVVEHASEFSGHSSKVILCGESAGGNLAAAVALLLRDTNQFKVAGQLLLYPVLASHLIRKHYESSPDKTLISYANMQFFWNAYLSTSEDSESPYASPPQSKNLANLPPCFIVTAEHDALKHEGESYGEALRKAGVAEHTKCYPGVIHGFLDLPLADAIKEEAFKDIAAWVKKL